MVDWKKKKIVHACHVPVCQWEKATPYFGDPTLFWSSCPHLEISRLQLYPSQIIRQPIALKLTQLATNDLKKKNFSSSNEQKLVY